MLPKGGPRGFSNSLRGLRNRISSARGTSGDPPGDRGRFSGPRWGALGHPSGHLGSPTASKCRFSYEKKTAKKKKKKTTIETRHPTLSNNYWRHGGGVRPQATGYFWKDMNPPRHSERLTTSKRYSFLKKLYDIRIT